MATGSGGVSSQQARLGLGGTTIRAMTLIAPGAFLWTTFSMQAQIRAHGSPALPSMWFGLFVAVLLSFLAAFAYRELARLYPGAGISYIFAEQAFLRRKSAWPPTKAARFLVSWAGQIYYTAYPAVMVAMIGSLTGYLCGFLFHAWAPSTPPPWFMGTGAAVFAVLVVAFSARGIQGSTSANLTINILQIATLILITVLFLAFRARHPELHYVHSDAASVIAPHGLSAVLSEASVAILLLVGFESVSSISDEVKNPERNIPLAVILSLAIQGLFCYLLEYFAANYALNEGPTPLLKFGAADAVGSAAPIGDLLRIAASDVFGSSTAGFSLMVFVALVVFVALAGSTISSIHAGARVAFAMAKDDLTPLAAGIDLLSIKRVTPYMSLLGLAIISTAAGVYGAWFSLPGASALPYPGSPLHYLSAFPNGLMVIVLLSNLGTLALYGMTCLLTMVAYWRSSRFNLLVHGLCPAVGALLSFGLIIHYFWMGVEAGIALIVAALSGAASLMIIQFRKTPDPRSSK